jgi:hypothetical protein
MTIVIELLNRLVYLNNASFLSNYRVNSLNLQALRSELQGFIKQKSRPKGGFFINLFKT